MNMTNEERIKHLNIMTAATLQAERNCVTAWNRGQALEYIEQGFTFMGVTLDGYNARMFVLCKPLAPLEEIIANELSPNEKAAMTVREAFEAKHFKGILTETHVQTLYDHYKIRMVIDFTHTTLENLLKIKGFGITKAHDLQRVLRNDFNVRFREDFDDPEKIAMRIDYIR